MIRNVLRVSLAGAALMFAAHAAQAQQAQPAPYESPLTRNIERIDFAINGTGEFTKQVQGLNFSGTVATQTPVEVSEKPSSTAGALVTLRYTKSRWFGLELNAGYARYTETFGGLPSNITPQVNAEEASAGYVVHPGKIFGVQTFASAGSGTMQFHPTAGGGLGYPSQFRQVYYWEGGAEAPLFGSNFGVRLQYRQQYYLAPDFETNYLRIKQHAITNQPAFGFYLHF